MSKIDDMIKNLCPNGVEHKKLAAITKSIKTGLNPRQNFKLNVSSAQNYYVTVKEITTGHIVFSEKTDRIDNDALKVIQSRSALEMGDVLFSGIGTIGKTALVDIPVSNWNVSESVFLIKPIQSIIIPKFLMYILGSSQVKKQYENQSVGSTLKGVRMATLLQLSIPVPPLPVQEEIVRILDSFTMLEAELEAELEARKKQYEYYRDKLLSFNELHIDQTGGVRLMALGDLFDFKNGLNKAKEFFGSGSPIVNFTDVFKKNYLYEKDLNGRVKVTSSEIERFGAKRGDVFFTRTSETREEVGMASVLLDDVENCVFSGFVLRARPKTSLLFPKYCGYCLRTHSVRKQIVQHASFTTRALTSGTVLSKIVIPVPALVEQERIVSILDKFDALVNDLTSGLPAELSARRQQYEYYRDRLLSFTPISQGA